jgi:hypothetical protein
MLEVKITLEEVRTRLCHGHHGCLLLNRREWRREDKMVVIVDGQCLRTVGSNSYMERIWGCGSQTMMVEIASAKMIHALCSDQTNLLSKAQDYSICFSPFFGIHGNFHSNPFALFRIFKSILVEI